MMRRIIWQLSIAVVVLVLGCSARSDERLPAANEVPKTSGAVPVPGSLFSGKPIGLSVTRDGTRQALDEQVLSIVIADLIEYKGKDAVAQAPMNRSEKIYLDKAFEHRYTPTKEGVLKKYKAEFWKAIEDLDSLELESAATNISERTKKARQFKLATADSRVLTNRSLIPKSSRDLERPIRLYVPGYNAKEDVCVVFAYIPWSGWHHADATFILQKVDGKWILRLRQYVVYV